MVPDGVEEVELAKVNLEEKERVQRLILDDIRKLSPRGEISVDPHPEIEMDFWMIACGRCTLVCLKQVLFYLLQIYCVYFVWFELV